VENKQHRKEVLCIQEAAEKWFKFERFCTMLENGASRVSGGVSVKPKCLAHRWYKGKV